ncbi:RluA family pseudouridine synthase [Pontibacterium sp.]|uniref:RluA family pseudouridine synthase n=1 Tax=Pontibacterium sp. TaxID=2036026 RepID=UPI0035196F73
MPEILYADDQLVVVNKPADLLSVPGRGEDKQDCVWRRVQQAHPTARIVHRLDYATSGLMVLALNADSHRYLSNEFQQRRTEKSYQAVVFGDLEGDRGEVQEPLRCDWENRPLQIVDYEHGKQAHTRWKMLQKEAKGTRVQLYPITGRSHQLRVHMQFLGHPIVGDRFYAPEEAQALSPRLLLHAEELGFSHPETGDWMDFHAPVPF